LTSLPRPGGSANDADVEIAPEELTLGSTTVPAGTLLFIDGESGPAEIYAVDTVTGSVLATLNTNFGVSHIVGGAYHPERNTFFLVQDRVPGSADENRIAEINSQTGAVINTVQVTGVFSINYGDIDVNASGNLLVVSSDENRIAEFTPGISLVQYLPLPAGVTGLSGIGVDDALGQLLVTNTSGITWRLGDGVLPGDYNSNGTVDAADYVAWRKNDGEPAGTLPNDIDGGPIRPVQYDTWQAHFGETAGPGAAAEGNLGTQSVIPEPTSLMLLTAVGLLGCLPVRIR
jgi:hypothetical protein